MRVSFRSQVCAAMLVSLVLLIPGCAPASEPESSSSSAVVMGPYPLGVVMQSDVIRYEMVAVEVGDAGWVRLDERRAYGKFPSTKAAPGFRYVDVTVRITDTQADPDSTAAADTPPHGVPYVIADGERFESISNSVEQRSAEFPAASRLINEFELPEGAAAATFFLPTSEEETRVASFRLW